MNKKFWAIVTGTAAVVGVVVVLTNNYVQFIDLFGFKIDGALLVMLTATIIVLTVKNSKIARSLAG